MDKLELQKRIEEFEREVIIKGLENGGLNSLRKQQVPVDRCKLSRTFGKCIGSVVDTDLILTVDYYGYLKKSRGFYKAAENVDDKTIRSNLIHFASIKIEDITNVTQNVDVIVGFAKLKNQILIERGFRKVK